MTSPADTETPRDDLLDWLVVIADGRLVVSLYEAGRMLGCSEATVRRLIADGELESFATRKMRKVSVPSILKFIQRRLDDKVTPDALRRKLQHLRNQQRHRVQLVEDGEG